MATSIKSIAKLRENLESKLAKLRKAIDCDLITLHLYDNEHEQLYFPIGKKLLEEKVFFRSVPSMERVAGKIIRMRQPIIANDAEHHPDMTGPFTHREKIKASAGFPVKNVKTEEIVGVVFLSYRSAHTFDDNEINQIEKWSNDTATFVEQVFKTNEGKLLRTTIRHDAGLRQKAVRLQNILIRLREVLRSVDVILWLPQKGKQKLEISASAGVAIEGA